jgi:DNA-directed RNA polymerase subunit RPC12/RpoP
MRHGRAGAEFVEVIMIDRNLTFCFRRQALILLAAVGFGLLAAPVVGWAGEPKGYSSNFYHDFRSGAVHQDMIPVGDKDQAYTKVEPQGLRITVPKAWQHPFGGVGYRTLFEVQGDFVITAGFEILHADVPERGYGVGVCMRVSKAEPSGEVANVCRVVRAKNRQVVLWDRSIEAKGEKRKIFEGTEPCAEKIGRLRLQRTGTILHFSWAPGLAGEDFKEIHKEAFGADDIKTVSLVGLTGREPCDVDVRFFDLRIRSGGLAQAAAKDQPKAKDGAPSPDAPTTNPPGSGSKGWLAVLLLVGLAFILLPALALGAWLYLRQRLDPPDPSPSAAAKDQPASSSVSLACPDCGKKLKAKAEMAGKKVKCSQCGKAVLVPSEPEA